MNEEDIMNRNFHIRQTGLVDPARLTMPIEIVGVGSIGGWSALALCKLGCEDVTVLDGDVVDEHNVGSQIYSSSDIRMAKVTALANKVSLLTESRLLPVASMWDERIDLKGEIIIGAVDSMDARERLYKYLLGRPVWLVDGRMAGNEINIYTMKMDDSERTTEYQETLFSDEEALPVPCSERSVMYNCFMVGSLMADIVAHIANRKEVPFEIVVDLMNFTMVSD